MAENPFDPYNLAAQSTYQGRDVEIATVKGIITDTANGSARHFLMLGQRGSGKTSLMNFAREESLSQAVIPIYCSVDSATNANSLFAKVGLAIDRELGRWKRESGKAGQILEELRSRLGTAAKKLRNSKIKLGIVDIQLGRDDTDTDLTSIVSAADLLCEALGDLASYSKSVAAADKTSSIRPITGMLLLLDEADTAVPEIFPLGSVVKILTEILHLRDVRNIAIGISGLPTLLDNLLVSHKSSLRAFKRVTLGELREEHLSAVLDACCALAVGAPTVLSRQSKAELVRLAEGYPHWLRHYASMAYDAARARQPGSLITTIELADVEISEAAAVKEIGDAYFRHDFQKLQPLQQRLIIGLTGARKEEGDVARLSSLLGQDVNEEKVISLAQELRSIGILGAPTYRGSQVLLDFANETYRRWAELHSLEFRVDNSILGLDKVLDALEERGAAGEIEIWGEEIAAFLDFASLMKEDTRRWRQIKLTFRTLDHAKLFAALPSIGSPNSPIEKMLMTWGPVGQTAAHLLAREQSLNNLEGEAFIDPWERADIIAIPHYLIGYARARGIVNLDDVLDVRKNTTGREIRNILSTYCMAFEETCTYRGDWVAVPHTVLAKVIYHRGGLTDELDSWEAIFQRAASPNSPRPLCEDEVGEISLWYEWQTVLAESNAQIFFRHIGEDKPDVTPEFQALELAAANGDRQAISRNPLFEAVANLWTLVKSQHDDDCGQSGWWDALKKFKLDSAGEKYLCFSGWSDCARELTACAPATSKAVRVRATPYFRSTTSRGRARQPLEGWVFVIPDRAEGRRGTPSLPHRHSRRNANVTNKDLALLLLATLRRDWQRQFHNRTGCSPLRTVFGEELSAIMSVERKSQETRERESLIRLGSIVQGSVFESIAKGKGVLEYYRMRAELTLISCLIYNMENGRPKPIDGLDELVERAIALLPGFQQCLADISYAEDLCHSW